MLYLLTEKSSTRRKYCTVEQQGALLASDILLPAVHPEERQTDRQIKDRDGQKKKGRPTDGSKEREREKGGGGEARGSEREGESKRGETRQRSAHANERQNPDAQLKQTSPRSGEKVLLDQSHVNGGGMDLQQAGSSMINRHQPFRCSPLCRCFDPQRPRQPRHQHV